MSDIPNLKLIHAVDPTKIKVTINEKFSKLTLSSNKKKRNEPTKPTEPKEIEKRQSASRNLLEDLTEINKENATCVEYSNAILRSGSSSVGQHKNETELTETLTQMEDMHYQNKNITQSSMERLQISDENELDDLTQKVSSLTVAGECKLLKSENETYETIDLVAEETDEEESFIYISDSDDEKLGPPGPNDQYNLMITSDIVKTDETGAKILPCTLSNERADRIEAFLRDVSQERRNIAATGGYLAEDSFLVHLPTPTDNVHNVENVLRNSFKAKQLAIADTESMKTNTDSLHRSLHSNKQREMALNDTEAMSESAVVTLFKENNQNLLNELGGPETAARRLAHDETEVNTTIESANNTLNNSEHNEVHTMPEESIIISETSSEDCNVSGASRRQKSQTDDHELMPSEEVLSNSIKHANDDSEDSSIGLKFEKINISAKINIKLQIRANFSSSEENNSTGGSGGETSHSSSKSDDDDCNAENNNENIQHDSSKDIGLSSKAESELVAKEKQVLKSKQNPETNTPTAKSATNFMSNAEKLLTDLYGQTWKTPDIIKSLKRTENPKLHQKGRERDIEDDNVKIKRATRTKTFEESQLLDDFLTFRTNIEKTNMDSTRLVTTKSKDVTKKPVPKEVQTEPRLEQKSKKKPSGDAFKTPQTELKKKPLKPANERWRQLVDNDSEPDNNASDDDHVEKTLLTDDESATDDDKASNASDSSWQALTEDEGSVEEDEKNDDGVYDKKKTGKQKSTKAKSRVKKINAKANQQKDELIYMDLSKDEISIVQKSESPLANHDENFSSRLSALLDSCRHEDKPKLEATPKSTGKSKRRLFNANFGDDDIYNVVTGDDDGILKEKNLIFENHDKDSELVRFKGVLIPPSFNIFNKRLESVKTGKPVNNITPPRFKEPHTPINSREESSPFKTPQRFTTPKVKGKKNLNELSSTPSFKYSFLKSLDVCVGKSLCHPDALVFRESYRQKKEDLAKILFELYNGKLFNNELNVPIQWNKKLLNTAGRCLNKKKAGERISIVELSEKVLTSADRLRCTLIHELCHAATWVFNGEGGHGATWKEWACKANAVFPDLPKIGVCHQYDIEYKYTYKCTLCAAKSYYHSKSKKVENIRCSYCFGAIEIFLNKKDKEGNIMPTPVKEPTGFAKFVKEKYKQYKRPDIKHADVMKMLGSEYSALKEK